MTDETTDVAKGLLAEGKRFYGQGDPVKARGCVEEAFRLAPGNTEVAVFLAHLYMEAKDSSRAERLLTEMIAQGVDHPVARMTLTQVYLEMNRLDEAMHQLDSVWLDISKRPALEKQFAQVVTKLAYKGLELWEQGQPQGRHALEGAMRLRPTLRWVAFMHKWLRSRDAVADIGQLVLQGQINEALGRLQSEDLGPQLNQLLDILIDTQRARLTAEERVSALEADLSSLRLNLREQAKELDMLKTHANRLSEAEQELTQALHEIDRLKAQVNDSRERNRQLAQDLETSRQQSFQLMNEASQALRQEVGDVFERMQALMEESFQRTENQMESAFSRSQLVMEEAFAPPVPTLKPDEPAETWGIPEPTVEVADGLPMAGPEWEPALAMEPEPTSEALALPDADEMVTASMQTPEWELAASDHAGLEAGVAQATELNLAEAPLEWSALQIANASDLQFEAGDAELVVMEPPAQDGFALPGGLGDDDELMPLEEITLEAWKDD